MLIKKHLFRDPDGSDGNRAEGAAAPSADKDVPTIAEKDPGEMPSDNQEAVPLDDPKANIPTNFFEEEQKKPEEKKDPVSDEETPLKEEEKPKIEDEKPEVDPKVKKSDEEVEGFDFKIDELKKKEEKEEQPDQEASWISLGKDLGLIVAKDDQETFLQAFNEEKKRIADDAKKEPLKLEIEKFDPKAQRIIEFVNSGGNIDDFLTPLKPFDEVLSLDDEGIVKKDLELMNWDTEKIEDQLAILKEEGRLETKAYELRKIVENQKVNYEKQLVDAKKSEKESLQIKVKAEIDKENQNIKNHLEKTEEFLGFPLKKELREAIYNKWERGDYRKRFQNDPELVAKAMLFWELGEQAVNEIKKTAGQEGTKKVLEKLHKVPQAGDGGTSRAKQPDIKSDNPFDAWKVIESEKVSVEEGAS